MDEFLDQQDEEPTAPFWMTTFSDMVTLLLTFFVLIVSMSEVKLERFQEALSHFQGKDGVLHYDTLVPSIPSTREEVYRQREESLDELLSYLRANDLEEKVEVNLIEDGVRVSITDSVMFNSGRADLLTSAEKILTKVGEVLTPLADAVVVEGHTDNRPISTAQFPSNWELSGARASSVVRFFLEQDSAIDPGAYKTIGFGEFRPIATNATDKGRARNRRVEILFSHDGNE